MLLNYAKDHQFDPLIAQNWYSVLRKDVKAYEVQSNFKFKIYKNLYLMQGGLQLVEKYGGSLLQSVKALFPEIGFSKSDYLASKSKNIFYNYIIFVQRINF